MFDFIILRSVNSQSCGLRNLLEELSLSSICPFQGAASSSTGSRKGCAALKIRGTLATIAETCVTATIVGSAGYAAAQTPPGLHRPNPQVIVCASLTDVYDVAVKNRNTKERADFTQLLKEGKCASVPAQLVDFWWYFDHYEDGNGHPGYFSEVSFAGIKHHLYTITETLPSDVIQATWKARGSTSVNEKCRR
jgi:hypothetical protein